MSTLLILQYSCLEDQWTEQPRERLGPQAHRGVRHDRGDLALAYMSIAYYRAQAYLLYQKTDTLKQSLAKTFPSLFTKLPNICI